MENNKGMLSLENVSVNYGAIEALTGVTMHVEQGEVVTLIGANGAGKTTDSPPRTECWGFAGQLPGR